MKLKGKVAIITGAGRGMGRAVAEGYAREGASLVLTAAREKEELDEVTERLNALGVLASNESDGVTGQRIIALEWNGQFEQGY